MGDHKSVGVKARARARELLTERVAARRAAEKANEADLAELLQLIADAESNDETLVQAVANARTSYDAAVAKLRDVHGSAASKIKTAQSMCVRRLRERGEPSADIAALTGMTAIEVGRLSRNGADHDPHGAPAIVETPAPFAESPKPEVPGIDLHESAPHVQEG